MGYLEDIEKIKNANLDASPFLEAVDYCRNLIQQCLSNDLPDEAKNQVETALRLIDENRAEFVKAFNEEVPDLQHLIHDSLDKLADQIREMEEENRKNTAYLESLSESPDLSEDPAKNPFHPAKLVASVPSQVPSLLNTPDLPFSGGQVLVQNVLNLKSVEEIEKDSRALRTTGNIWENWKKTGQ